jgi:site-specific recombinase XerD
MDIQIRQFIKYLALERRYSEHTVKSYKTDLIQFEHYLLESSGLQKIHWNLITKKSLRGFMVFLQGADISLRSVARKIATIKSFFKYLSREEIISQNPSASIKMPKYDKKLPEFISPEEIRQIFKIPNSGSFEDMRDLAILELFYGTGIRLSELVNIKVTDIYFKEDLIRVIGKGNKERIIPFGSYARDILLKYLENRTQIVAENVDNVFV